MSDNSNTDVLYVQGGMATRPTPPTTLRLSTNSPAASLSDDTMHKDNSQAPYSPITQQPQGAATQRKVMERGMSGDVDSPLPPPTRSPSSHVYSASGSGTCSDVYETEDYDTETCSFKTRKVILPGEIDSLLRDGLEEDSSSDENITTSSHLPHHDCGSCHCHHGSSCPHADHHHHRNRTGNIATANRDLQNDMDLLAMSSKCLDKAEEIARRVWMAGWTVVHHNHLPKWLRDNDFLICGHRPPLHSFLACFKSIFRVHTETGNIWTHLLGFVAFIGIATYFNTRPSIEIQWQEKAVFSAFFIGAILCMGFSWVFHTVYCHSEGIGKLFNKLDYCGIALLTMGSFVPWLYYSFYCRLSPKIVYLVLIIILGSGCIIVSMWDKFAEPKFRPVRAGLFIGLGLSGIIPAMHYVITDGFYNAIHVAALGWLVLMAILYITGALIYASRFPERIWPGKFDIMFQSHQIFHVFVLAAAFVHYHGISEIANYRLTFGDCTEEEYVEK